MAGAGGEQQNGTEAEGLASTHTQKLTKLNYFCSAKSNPVQSVKVSGFTPAPRYQAMSHVPPRTEGKGWQPEVNSQRLSLMLFSPFLPFYCPKENKESPAALGPLPN